MCSIMGYSSHKNYEEFKKGFETTVSRGPDMSKIVKNEIGYIAFHRLSIMGLHDEGS